MVILTLTHMYPYPATDGGKIVTYNTLKYMNKKGIKNILITFNNFNVESELNNIAEVNIVKKNTINNPIKMFLNLFSYMPYNISKYKDKRVNEIIDEILEREKIDIIYIDHLHMAIYAKYISRKYPNIKLVLRQHNVETTIMNRFYKNQTNLLVKVYAYIQYIKLKKYESKITDFFDLLLMLTDNDKLRMEKMCKNKRVKTISAGVDTERYYSSINIENDSIVFLGAMNWLPNEDGVLWFVNNVLDKIIEKKPNVKFYIVGKNPSEKIKKLQNNNIIVTGFVEDDRMYIEKASVFIVPLRIGGGMRIKILNSMAMNKCIVSTTIGAEGIDVVNDKEIYIEDNADMFAEKILYAMNNHKKSNEIGKNARKKIVEKYSWEAIIKEICNEIDVLIKGE